MAAPISDVLPWGTILINVAGSFVIGFFGTLTLAHGRYPLPKTTRLFVMVGLCGGFTTFSSFSLQTLDLLRAGATGRALVNIAVSVAVCLVAVALGHVLGAARRSGSDHSSKHRRGSVNVPAAQTSYAHGSSMLIAAKTRVLAWDQSLDPDVLTTSSFRLSDVALREAQCASETRSAHASVSLHHL